MCPTLARFFSFGSGNTSQSRDTDAHYVSILCVNFASGLGYESRGEELGIIETNEPQKSHGAGEISETVTKEVRIQKLKGLFISKEIIVSISTMLRPIHGISF